MRLVIKQQGQTYFIQDLNKDSTVSQLVQKIHQRCKYLAREDIKLYFDSTQLLQHTPKNLSKTLAIMKIYDGSVVFVGSPAQNWKPSGQKLQGEMQITVKNFDGRSITLRGLNKYSVAMQLFHKICQRNGNIKKDSFVIIINGKPINSGSILIKSTLEMLQVRNKMNIFAVFSVLGD